jgi:FtsP/CotA-like multicopper oxidase with cupredoxin domain
MSDRRAFISRVAALFAARNVSAQPSAASPAPVEVPDLPKLPSRMVDGVKEFHLIAEVVTTEFVPGRKVHAWGYNGSVPGPLLEANQGDRVRVIFENRLPEMTALHWHGFEVPMTQDGSLGLGQDPTPPGGKHVYEFTLNQHGTFFYHSHFPMQEMMGMLGMFVLHPASPPSPRVDKDFGIVIQEWMLLPNNTIPNTLAMEFNWLTFNGRSGPDCTPMIARLGDRVRIRFVNLGMDHHPMHLHGNTFYVTGTEAGRIPGNRWIPENTVIVGVGQARDIEFDANYVGDWMLHCHLPHHMMNQMIPMVGPVDHGAHAHHMTGGFGMYPIDDPSKKQVPGYPQDMWMNFDEWVRPKPENHGLRAGWAAAMGGMMTLVRVLPSDKYDEMQEMRGKPVERQHHHPEEKKK